VRDLNLEFQDNVERKYAYEFDWILRRYLLRTISPHFDLSGKTLELGCFQGDMTKMLLDFFPRMTVVEGAEDLCGVVEQRFPGRLTVINSTFENVTLQAEYQNIFLVHTLEHLDDPIALLKKIKAWLAPGGRLYIAVPNANALSRQIAVKMGLIRYNSAVTEGERLHGHRLTYSIDMLEYHLHEAGFRCFESGGVVLKPLANFQFDRALAEGIVDQAYLDGCYELGKRYPDLCASLYAVCE
jgi:SAM-dependent methyltransferase